MKIIYKSAGFLKIDLLVTVYLPQKKSCRFYLFQIRKFQIKNGPSQISGR